MSPPELKPDYRSLWEGYNMSLHDVTAARERELATTRMRLAMGGLNPESEHWQEEMNKINAKYDTELEGIRGGSGYDQLTTGFQQSLTAVFTPTSSTQYNIKEYGTEMEGYQKGLELDQQKIKDFAKRLEVTPQQLEKIFAASTGVKAGEMGLIPVGQTTSELGMGLPQYKQVEVSQEDIDLFHSTMEKHYSTAFKGMIEDPTKKTAQEKGLERAREAAASGGATAGKGARRGASGSSDALQSPNISGESLLNPLQSEDETSNPWL